MKKLLVSAVSVAALAAPAMAQEFVPAEYENSAMIEQIGTANQAITDQTWGGLINGQALSMTTQNGDSNRATTFQTGFTSTSGSYENTAEIIQGENPAGNGSGVGNEARVRQIHDYGSGGANNARVLQPTDNGFAVLRQRGFDNDARITQTRASANAIARVDQNGNNNFARVIMRSTNGDVDIDQGRFRGVGNISGAPAESTFNRAVVRSFGVNDSVFVEQYGSTNRATVDVTDTAISGIVNVRTDGFFNDVTVEQAGQSGTINVNQNQLVMLGDNTATVRQASGDFESSATINQDGYLGVSTIIQGDLSGSLSSSNNEATATQTGSSMSAESSILQTGSMNTANVTQATAAAMSTVTQMGVSQTASVSQ